MIVFENVTKKFLVGSVALNNISLKVDRNEFVFLVGPSGAGKTTILKLILREYLPTSGKILVNDFTISSKKFKQIEELRRSIGIIFQDFKVLLDKNIFENIAISLKILDTPASEIKSKIQEVLTLVNLQNKESVFPSQLSAGELQRVAIARAVIGRRDIILADEPTGNLDPKTSWEVMKIFKKLEGKKTIIFATHNTDIVNSMQKRVLVIKEGKLVKDIKKGGYEL
jgi:cell division transport system ATP-binding protein